MKRWLIVFSMLVAATAAQAQAPSSGAEPWSARDVDDELVEAVVRGNLFAPEQRRAPRVETPAVEDEPDTEPERTIVEQPPEPDDPGKGYRLVGISRHDGRWLAFIEESGSGLTHRIAPDQPIAAGVVAQIEVDRITYTPETEADTEVASEPRIILIGRDLTGAVPEPSLESAVTNLFVPESTAKVPSGSDSDTDASSSAESTNETPPTAPDPGSAEARRAELLRQMRERRERESQ